MTRVAELGLGDIPVALLVCGPDGRVEDANGPACELLGQDRECLVGAETLQPALAAAASAGAQRGAFVHLERPDGTRLWVRVDAARALRPDGGVRRVVVALTDLTAVAPESAPWARGEAIPELADMTQQMADARLGPEGVLTTVTTGLSRVRPGTWVASLINKDARSVRVAAANSSDPMIARYVEDMHRSGEASASSVAMRVIESGRPFLMPRLPYASLMGMLTSDVQEYMGRNSIPRTRKPAEVLGVLIVPMRARGATVGTLGVFDWSPGTALGEDDLGWLQQVADRAGLAAENAQLYSDAVRRLERLTALRNIGLAVSSSTDLRLTLQVILDQVLAGLRVDAADIFLADETEGTLVMAAQAGFHSTSVPDYRLPVDETLPGRLLSRPRVESVGERSALAEFRRRTLFAREGFRFYCAAPLMARSRPAGVLEVFTRSAVERDDEWIGFLETLAGQAAVAVDGAKMAERLREAGASPRRHAGPAPRLNPLERQILGLLVEGTTNADIAHAVHLSQSTVKFHVRQILQRVGAANRTELARKATREGWL